MNVKSNANLFVLVHQGVQLVPRQRVSRSTTARRRRHPRSSRHLHPRRRRRRPAGTWCSPPGEAPVRGRTGRRLRGIQRWRNFPRSPQNPPVDASHRPVAAPRRPNTHPPSKTSWLHLPPRFMHTTGTRYLLFLAATSNFSSSSCFSASGPRDGNPEYLPTGSLYLTTHTNYPRRSWNFPKFHNGSS